MGHSRAQSRKIACYGYRADHQGGDSWGSGVEWCGARRPGWLVLAPHFSNCIRKADQGSGEFGEARDQLGVLEKPMEGLRQD